MRERLQKGRVGRPARPFDLVRRSVRLAESVDSGSVSTAAADPPSPFEHRRANLRERRLDDKLFSGGYNVPMKSLSDIRSGFLEFFRERGHAIVPSSPLVPRNDPTLLFTNAGMVQFKNVFTGAEKRPYTRATSVQKCVRAGGKHNDLDNVGYTARHHTFFEMLGNFSFGDYFKEEAILYAWDFVTKSTALPKDKLLVTIYPTDEQARALWKKIAGLSDDRIIGHHDNLWAMGPLGPCGFCSEIFFDQGDSVRGGPPGSPDEDGDRFLEFWNLVFMQFEQIDEKTRVELPKPSIDTGMGLERIAAILQGVHNNYDTDLFRHLIAVSVEMSGAKSEGEAVASHRVIADHLRATSFLIADGVLPSNEGRGYVLRRIMRRAMRHAHLIGSKDPLMYRLVPTLVAEMGTAYPELKRAEALVAETLKLEETRFRETLARGLKLLDETTGSLKSGDRLAGETAFKLYDTYGFPLDLTQDALKARGIGVDTDGFGAAMGVMAGPVTPRIFEYIAAPTIAKREALPGLEPGRADIILGGAIILEQAMEVFGIDELVVSDYALREGALLDAFQRRLVEP